MESARLFSVQVARLLADTRCSNVVVLDVTGISPITDFLVIATGTSPRQMNAAADAAEELGEPMNFRPLARVGDSVGQWVVIDFVDAVVHLFNCDTRQYYDLDGLWGDARKVEWRNALPPVASATRKS